MKKILCLMFIFYAAETYATDSLTIQDHTTISVLEERVNSFQKQLDDTKDLQNAKKEEIEKLMQQKEDALDQRMLLYSGFFAVILAIAAWFFNWLGKREIRNITSELATKQVDSELKTKFSADVINEKITELGVPLIKTMIREKTVEIE